MENRHQLRVLLKNQRQIFHQNHGQKASESLSELFLQSCFYGQGQILGFYWPIQTEINPLPLAQKLLDRGFSLSLPVIEGKNLFFRLWNRGEILQKGLYGTCWPGENKKQVDPCVVLTPLLGFSRQGHRLGYGKGFYDRFLFELSKKKPVQAIGLAYHVQECDFQSHDHDYQLDAIMTDKELIKIKNFT